MHKKRIIPIFAALTLLAATYLLAFTATGELLRYNAFGGNDLHLTSGVKQLYWFDVRHSNDPKSPMFGRIEAAFTRFAPSLLLVEGGFDSFEGDRASAIHQGESAFAAHIAKRRGVPVEDIEPPFERQVEYLQTKYSPEEILAMYLIRQISSILGMPDNEDWDFDANLLGQMRDLKGAGLNYSEETLEEILRIVNSYLPEPMERGSWRSADIRAVAGVYSREDGALYGVYNDVKNFRNIWLVQLLAEKKAAYDKIFVVMGGQHMRDTKAQLEQLYANAASS